MNKKSLILRSSDSSPDHVIHGLHGSKRLAKQFFQTFLKYLFIHRLMGSRDYFQIRIFSADYLGVFVDERTYRRHAKGQMQGVYPEFRY
jgi:hypothetical protein